MDYKQFHKGVKQIFEDHGFGAIFVDVFNEQRKNGRKLSYAASHLYIETEEDHQDLKADVEKYANNHFDSVEVYWTEYNTYKRDMHNKLVVFVAH